MGLPKANLVVVGHKDHGKSTLIGRLLYDSKVIPEQKLQEIRDELESAGKEFEFAYILDSLEEERVGGLTIDIMQTPFKSEKYFYTIIDCPGHREFIEKMLTGASQAEAAVLVVSAKEGIEDQTRQHLFLIETLGIRQLVVAVNKMDLTGFDEQAFKRLSGKVEQLLGSRGYGDVPVVPVSAFKGDNVTKRSSSMGWYRGPTLIEALDGTVKPLKPSGEKRLRCVVQDVYDVEGRRMAVCRVEAGVLRVGHRVMVMPIGEKGIVERIDAFGEKVRMAVPGDSVGAVLKGVERVERGFVLASEEERLKPTAWFVSELIVFADFRLRVGDKVTVRVGTAEVECKMERILERRDPVDLTVEEETPVCLENGEVGKVLLRPLEPLYLEVYSQFPQLGRFVVVGRKGAAAAGVVLEKGEER